MKISIVTLVATACLAFSPLATAQGQQSQQSQQTQQSQGQQNPPQQTQRPSLANPLQDVFPQTPPPADPKEEAAYKAFSDIQPAPANNDAQIKAGEDFVKNFPQSRYREAVYSRLANAYLDKNDADKMCDAADKALALNPNDITVLIPVGEAIPRTDPKASAFATRLAKAEQYEKHALDLLNTMSKPAGLSDEEFSRRKNDAASEAHSGLGLVYFDERKFDQSSAELQSATGGTPELKATNLFVLGLDFVNLQKYPEAVKAFDSCSQISSPLQDRCKQASREAAAREGAAPKK